MKRKFIGEAGKAEGTPNRTGGRKRGRIANGLNTLVTNVSRLFNRLCSYSRKVGYISKYISVKLRAFSV